MGPSGINGWPCAFKRKREEDHAILGIHLERCLQKKYRAPLNTTRTIAVKDILMKNNTEEAGSLNFAKSIFLAFAVPWGCFKQLGAPFAQIPSPCPLKAARVETVFDAACLSSSAICTCWVVLLLVCVKFSSFQLIHSLGRNVSLSIFCKTKYT